jgi:hypothetical protein
MRRFHYDTITHSVPILEVFERLTGIPASDRELILGGNTMRLLKL